MRSRITRHLGSVLPELLTVPPTAPGGILGGPATPGTLTPIPTDPGPDAGTTGVGTTEAGSDGTADRVPVLPPEFNWRDYTVMLLHIAAEIEHSLMVQYLFAAYSLGGPDVPDRLRAQVRRWQEIILGIAKEEMGHFLTVQNLLTALGAPINLDREDYPWGTEFYPFPFTLRRLTPASLATYICAESPPGWSGDEATAIRRLAGVEAGQEVNQVGALYRRLVAVLGDRELVPDSDFQAATLPFQADWDEWGRGYTRGERGRDSGNVPELEAPELLILGVHSRDSALSALRQIGEQGEALDDLKDDGQDETSHFRRFLTIYQEMIAEPEDDRDKISRRLADNPRTSHRLRDDAARFATPAVAGTAHTGTDLTAHRKHISREITDPAALRWGHLFNLRYRMLLVSIAHAFRLSGPLDHAGALTARGILIHRAFGEMYNLRAIAGALVRLPVSDQGPSGQGPSGQGQSGSLRAGPPFEMPYTLDLPEPDRNRWLLQRDLVKASQLAVRDLRDVLPAADSGVPYLVAVADTDRRALELIERVLAGRGPCNE
ncbi:ferritin-like protein [Kitasatospora sp. NPDC048540]|uniref:ferritin-like domain-containing protein n=1 Tax=Kitasatospora sp. NPDC048540 TaxID=3155634 RepID=UPI0033DAEDDD